MARGRDSTDRRAQRGPYKKELVELARLVSSLLYGTRAMLVLNLSAFETKNTQLAYDRFYGNGPYGEIPTKKEPIKRSDLPCHIIKQ